MPRAFASVTDFLAHGFDDLIDVRSPAEFAEDHVPGAIYNVSSGTELSLREVVAISSEVLRVTAEPVWGSMAARPWDTATWRGESSSLRHLTGWQPQYSLRAGLVRTALWFDEHPEMKAYYSAAQAR